MGPRRARRRTDRLAASPAGRAPADARRHDDPRLPRVARLPDAGLRFPARSIGRARARLADRRARDLLWPHPYPRGPRSRLEDHRQRRLRRARLRWRPDGLMGPRRRQRDRGRGRDPARRVRHDGGRERDLGARPGRRRLSRRHGPDREARSVTTRNEHPWPEAPRRVVVTGMGVLTAVGNSVPATWEALVAGRSGIAPIASFDASRLQARIAGELKDFDPSGVIDRKDQRRFDRYIQFGLVAAREAMDQAGLPGRMEGVDAERTGVLVGTGLGGVGTLVEGITMNATRGPDRVSPFLVPMGIPNVGAGQVAISFGMTGPNFSASSACATGGHAIGEAWEIIRRNDADMMVAGGSEAGVHEPLVAGFDAMRALSRRNDDPQAASRPFDQARDGFVPGEGCGVLVLEELEHARARGAEILAEIIGYGATADASHITLPAPGGIGAVRAAQRAIAKAGLEPSDIAHVNAHATSTPEGDKSELQAIKTIFGDHAETLSITANKSMIGHTLGAAGAIEAISTIQTMREGCVPPTINLENVDPVGEGLNLTPNVAQQHDVPIALSNSFGFGGQNTALILRRWAE